MHLDSGRMMQRPMDHHSRVVLAVPSLFKPAFINASNPELAAPLTTPATTASRSVFPARLSKKVASLIGIKVSPKFLNGYLTIALNQAVFAFEDGEVFVGDSSLELTARSLFLFCTAASLL